ncbi:MAG: hypothetical protein ABJA74_09505 [Lapillicoccus sp.]
MPIEWMPRSRKEEDGWRDLTTRPAAPRAVLDSRSGVDGVRVPVLEQSWRLPRLPRLRARSVFLLLRVALFLVMATVYLGMALVQLLMTAWPARLVLAFLVSVAVYRSCRLRRWGHGSADPLLRPDGLHVEGLFVPWYQVEEVVRFNFLAPMDRSHNPARNFVAVRVRDFVGVAGLTPVRAGLANLTRRHLIVLAEASEVRNPQALTAALEVLVADPESRAVLSTPDGCRFVDEGPARPTRQSP